MDAVLSVIIVNFNTAALLPDCLDSLQEQLSQGDEILVVDNGSTDGSVQVVKDHYSGVVLVENEDNRGFSRANNQALALCSGDLIFFLNPDTVIMPGCLEQIKLYMEQHKEVGLAGTKTLNVDLTEHPTLEYDYPGCHYSGDELSGLPGEIAWVLGCAMVTRSGLMAELGGFDERYFLYAEDIDLCCSVRKAGYSLGYIENARIIHYEGKSADRFAPAVTVERKMHAECLFFQKHYSAAVTKKIRIARWLQAWWRVVTLRVTLFFRPSSIEAAHKLEKYEIARRMYKPWSDSFR